MAARLLALGASAVLLAGIPEARAADLPALKADKLDALTLAKLIDREVERRLQAEGIKPAPRSDDGEFLRRVYLDIAGVIPSAERAAAYLQSTDPDKRAKLIEALLGSPVYGKHLSEVWTGMLVPRESNNRRLQAEPLRSWLEQGFNTNKPWNQLVRELVTASGAQGENGAVTFFLGNPGPDKLTDTVSRLFLGVQLQCAQCHNHPFTSWKQKEYWGMAAFFMRVKISATPQQAAKDGVSPVVDEAASQGKGKGKKGFKLPDSAKVVPAKFLQGEQPRLKPAAPLRPVLAEWMTSGQNPFFARAMVNRLWAHFLGRGLVNPVDDMHDENEPSHPELLAALTQQFKSSGFDVKYLIRAICNSAAYQRGSRAEGGNADDQELYSHMAVRPLSPEQLYDSLTAVLGTRQGGRDAGPKKNQQGGKKGGGGPREQFINFFRLEESNPLEYQAGIPQALRLMNSGPTNNSNMALAAARGERRTPAQVIESLYLTALCRRPTQAEAKRLTEYVGHQANARTAYADILWALVNSSEFAMNH